MQSVPDDWKWCWIRLAPDFGRHDWDLQFHTFVPDDSVKMHHGSRAIEGGCWIFVLRNEAEEFL